MTAAILDFNHHFESGVLRLVVARLCLVPSWENLAPRPFKSCKIICSGPDKVTTGT